MLLVESMTTRRGSGSAATERAVTETLGWQLLLLCVRWAGFFFCNVVSRGCWKKESFTSPPPEGKWHWNLQHVQSFDRNIRLAGLYCDVRWVRGGSNVISTSCWNNGPFNPPLPPLHAREEVTLELAAQNLQDVQIFLKLTETLGRQVYSIVM